MSDDLSGIDMGDWPDQILAQIDGKHRVYLCQYGIVHLLWDNHNLVYCPGDFLGLPFLLSTLASNCSNDRECSELDPTKKWVAFQYHSITLSFTCEDCLRMQKLVEEAADRLFELSNEGYFLNRAKENYLSI